MEKNKNDNTFHLIDHNFKNLYQYTIITLSYIYKRFLCVFYDLYILQRTIYMPLI